jgi:hypothetical protein
VAGKLEAAIAAMQDDFISACARVGRPLTPDEIAVVRRERSLLFLEAIYRPFDAGKATADDVESTLLALAERGQPSS